MRPTNLIYSVDERPPALICFVNALQQLTTVAPVLVYVILMMAGAGASAQATANAVSLTLGACGIAVLLQIFPGRVVGSGFLINMAPAAAFVPIGIEAIK